MAQDSDSLSDRERIDQQYAAVTQVFHALSTPVRAAIVHRLTVRSHTVAELVEELGISQPLASQHLRALRDAGLVEVDRQGRSAVYGITDDHVSHIFLDAYQHSRETTGRPADDSLADG